jgi:murein DD-endopeptidase MepM/ murein hydrolase activator NlpD
VFSIKSKAESVLHQLQSQINELATKESQLTHNMLIQQTELEILNSNILNLENDIKLRKTFIRNRLNYITREGGADLLEQFLFSKNPCQLEQNIKILKRISTRDIQSLKGYSISLRELKFKKSEVNGRFEKLKKLQDDLKQKEQKIATQLELREKVIKKLKSQKSNDDLDLITSLSHFFLGQRGKLNYPTQSHIESHFGVATDPESHVVFINEGIRLSSPSDGVVRAVSDGLVEFADWVDGYKYTLIISHGDHYYSVYKDLSDLQIKMNDRIKEGQVVGRAIQGIGFEIRHFNEPLDPKKWLNNKKSIAQESFHAITH